MSMKPLSCDTFVALHSATEGDCVIFGKNSDRPCAEVQEVVYYPLKDHEPGSKLECTYIEIEQVAHTHSIILSKPAWMWGAEMGANEHGVCIGNEAVWTKLNGPEDLKERLLGMDYVRLGLERSKTAQEAFDVITALFDIHGQGGPCSDEKSQSQWAYHNSFLIVDGKEAWVLETVGKHWAAQHVSSGVRNISNQLTIRTKIDKMSPGLKEHAQSKGYWKPDDGDFDFAKAYSDSFEETELKDNDRPQNRQQWGTKLMKDLSAEGKFKVQDMLSILRHENSGICMTGGFLTTGSQVSVLTPDGCNSPSCHWFTATPNPKVSIFKPFVFSQDATIGENTSSPHYGDEDPRKVKPRFEKVVERRHPLYKAHETYREVLDSNEPKGAEIHKQIQDLESICVDGYSMMGDPSGSKVSNIFQHMVDLEMNFYHK